MGQAETIQAFTLTVDEAALLTDYRLLTPKEREKLHQVMTGVVATRKARKLREERLRDDVPFARPPAQRNGGRG